MLLDLMASGRSFMQRARSRDLKLSPADCHGLMLGFTLDWGFKPHSKGDCKGIIMVVFFGGGGGIGRERYHDTQTRWSANELSFERPVLFKLKFVGNIFLSKGKAKQIVVFACCLSLQYVVWMVLWYTVAIYERPLFTCLDLIVKIFGYIYDASFFNVFFICYLLSNYSFIAVIRMLFICYF